MTDVADVTDAAPAAPEREAPSGPPLVEVRALTLRHEGNLVLDRVSLDVAPRSVHAVVGPNGAGKSSLFAALLGLTPFQGHVAFHWRGSGRIGFVPQTFAIDRTLPLTVEEFLALTRQRTPICLGVRRATRERARLLLERVGLAALAGRRLGALSGGELRRVLLANALDPEPELVLLDEPSTGLDPESIERLEATLLSLRAEHHVTVLMVSHDDAQVERVADTVSVLDRTIRATGPAAEVLAARQRRAPAREASA
ncbi:MAG: metal ABC transporter ATP-binding protein [Polyangiaceae bacterium]